MSFKPTFVVTVTPLEIVSGDTVKGQPFASMKDATISRAGRSDTTRTVMAFGSAAEIVSQLTLGIPVRLAVQHDEAILKVIGRPRDEALLA